MYSKPLLKFDGRDNPFSAGSVSPSPVYDHQMALGEIMPDSRLIESNGYLIAPRDFTPEQIALAESTHSHPVQPAQALGIFNALLIAGLLAAFFRLRTREGQVFALMLILYPITRFVLESIRADNPHDLLAGVLTHNQYTSLGTLIVGVAMMFGLRWLPPPAGATWVQRVEAKKGAATKSKNGSKRKRKR
jgi:prolipoprotein diacylglyceryltransferase